MGKYGKGTGKGLNKINRNINWPTLVYTGHEVRMASTAYFSQMKCQTCAAWAAWLGCKLINNFTTEPRKIIFIEDKLCCYWFRYREIMFVDFVKENLVIWRKMKEATCLKWITCYHHLYSALSITTVIGVTHTIIKGAEISWWVHAHIDYGN